jgi:biotin transport system substrate-specific component
MSTPSLAFGRPTLADRIFARGIVMDIVLIAAGAAFTSIMAQVAIPLWPVPITGQTLAVLLVGSMLGALRGGISLALYAVLGIVGVPVFSDASSGFGVVMGPTGGYIIGFIFAAALTGWIAQRAWDHKILRAILSFTAGTIVTFVFGLVWLWYALGQLGAPNDLQSVLDGGFYPFLIGGAAKAILAALIVWAAWKTIEGNDRRRAAANS